MNKAQTLRLISIYKEHKCLWDPHDNNYTKRGAREDAWRHISREMDNIPPSKLKKKMTSLMGGYRRERCREKQSRKAGSGGRYYKSRWFAFTWFKFLDRKSAKPKPENDEINTEEPADQQILSDENSTSEKQDEIKRVPRTRIPVSRKRTFHKLSRNLPRATPAPVTYDKRDSPTRKLEEDEFDAFGRNVALQLKQLPVEHALECQEQLQRVLKEHRIKSLQEQRVIEVSEDNTFTFKLVSSDNRDPLSGSKYSDEITSGRAKTEPVECSDSDGL